MALNSTLQQPYIVGNPVPPSCLFGRDDLLRRLEQHLSGRGNQSAILLGQRRIGKTSVLQALPYYRTSSLATVFLDMHALAGQPTVDHLKGAIGRKVAETLHLPIPHGALDEDHGFWDRAAQVAADKKKRLTLAIDEAELLDEESGRFCELRQWLLALQRDHNDLAFALAIGSPYKRLLQLGPLTKSGMTFVVPVLDEASARKTLLTPDGGDTPYLCFNEAAIKRILTITGRHPFLVQAFGAELFALVGSGTTISEQEVNSLEETIIERTQGQLDWYWNAFNNAERTVLAALALILDENPMAALADDGKAVREIARVLTRYDTSLGSLDVLAALDNLRGFDILDVNNRIQIELVQRWLLREHSLARIRLTAEERVEKLYQQGRQAESKRRLRDALHCYREATNEKPDFAPARLALADVLARLHYYRDAAEHYRAAYNLTPDLARDKFETFLMAEARRSLDQGATSQSVDLYQEALQLHGPHEVEVEQKLRRLAPQRARIALDLVPQMVPIPTGEFVHGVDWLDAQHWLHEAGVSAQGIDKLPKRQVRTLPTYLIAQTQVTNGQYQAFIRDTGHQPPLDWTEAGDFPPGRENFPVVYVSWDDAVAFCGWLSDETGRRFRLPTEWEWEKAARGGLYLDGDRSRTQRNPNPDRLWPWGDQWQWPIDLSRILTVDIDVDRLPGRLANSTAGSLGQRSSFQPGTQISDFSYYLPSWTHQGEGRPTPPRLLQAVDKLVTPQGPYDLVGLVGNVREWCEAVDDATGQPGDPLRRQAYKGAPAQVSPVDALCAARQLVFRREKRPDVGFRVVESER